MNMREEIALIAEFARSRFNILFEACGVWREVLFPKNGLGCDLVILYHDKKKNTVIEGYIF
jgi:hypothetical protein